MLKLWRIMPAEKLNYDNTLPITLSCRSNWTVCKRNPSAVLIFRGFRVRMGMHTGIPLKTDVTFNRTTGHMAYSGMPLKIAKAVGDAAAGGMVSERPFGC